MILKSERLILRPLEEKDIEMIRQWRNAYKEFFFDATEITKEMQRAWYQRYVESNCVDQMFIICLKESLTPIGQCAVYDISIPNRTAKFGRFLILNEFTNKGYAEEALRCLIDYCFNVLNLYKVRLEVYGDNYKAMAVYRKSGFEPTHRPIVVLEKVNPDFDDTKPVHVSSSEESHDKTIPPHSIS